MPRPYDPVGAFAMDEMADDIVWRPRPSALGRCDPLLRKPHEQRRKTGGRSLNDTMFSRFTSFSLMLFIVLTAHSDAHSPPNQNGGEFGFLAPLWPSLGVWLI